MIWFFWFRPNLILSLFTQFVYSNLVVPLKWVNLSVCAMQANVWIWSLRKQLTHETICISGPKKAEHLRLRGSLKITSLKWQLFLFHFFFHRSITLVWLLLITHRPKITSKKFYVFFFARTQLLPEENWWSLICCA